MHNNKNRVHKNGLGGRVSKYRKRDLLSVEAADIERCQIKKRIPKQLSVCKR